MIGRQYVLSDGRFCYEVHVSEAAVPLWVWLSSPKLMPEARSHVSKAGVVSGYTHTLRASANYTHSSRHYNSNSPVSHMDSHQQ